mmetsp:Transcript_3688/g.6283  ORF Transcript_3688/g.6283 Transcript_3688/m.6283 type:complete len:82 (+) Transcript_3688:1896-2141(+)
MVKPKVVQASQDKISRSQAYIFDDGSYISLFIGSSIPSGFATDILGQESFSDYAISIGSGVSPYQEVEGSESSQLLVQFID